MATQANSWTYLCETSAVGDDCGLRVEIAGHPALAVFRVDNAYFVTADTCTHGSASLADGYLEGAEIECPFHAGRFNVKTGEATKFPCVDALKVYPGEVRGNSVYASLGAHRGELTSMSEKSVSEV